MDMLERYDELRREATKGLNPEQAAYIGALVHDALTDRARDEVAAREEYRDYAREQRRRARARARRDERERTRQRGDLEG